MFQYYSSFRDALNTIYCSKSSSQVFFFRDKGLRKCQSFNLSISYTCNYLYAMLHLFACKSFSLFAWVLFFPELEAFFILPEKKDNILIVGGLAEPRCSFSIFMTERCARNCFHTPSYFISSSSSLKYKFICLFFLSTLWSISFSTMLK